MAEVTRAKHETHATDRDLAVLGWVAERGAVYQTDVGRLLARFDGRPHSDSAVRQLVERWRRAGWATGRRLLRHRPRIVVLTDAGAELAGLVGYRPPSGRWQAAERAAQQLDELEVQG